MADDKTVPDVSTAEQELARDAVMRSAGIFVPTGERGPKPAEAEPLIPPATENKTGQIVQELIGEPEGDPVDSSAEKKVNSNAVNKQPEPEPEPEEDGEGGNMSIIAHLTELRTRIIRCLIAVGLCCIVTYYYLDPITQFILAPAGKLQAIKPAEIFFTYMKIVIFSAFLLALPVIFYQIWSFFMPAMTRRERFVLGMIVPASVILFLGGIAFSFTVVLPAAMKFLMGVGDENVTPLISIEQYFEFMLMFVLPFGVVFEVPLVIIILAKLGIVTSAFLQKQFRLLIFFSFVFGAVISPTPDIFTQSAIALPLIALYGVGLAIVKYIMRK